MGLEYQQISVCKYFIFKLYANARIFLELYFFFGSAIMHLGCSFCPPGPPGASQTFILARTLPDSSTCCCLISVPPPVFPLQALILCGPIRSLRCLLLPGSSKVLTNDRWLDGEVTAANNKSVWKRKKTTTGARSDLQEMRRSKRRKGRKIRDQATVQNKEFWAQWTMEKVSKHTDETFTSKFWTLPNKPFIDYSQFYRLTFPFYSDLFNKNVYLSGHFHWRKVKL